jgi:hypothetical protein
MVGYKVVRVWDNRYWSVFNKTVEGEFSKCLLASVPDLYSVEYIINQVVIPSFGPLALFDTIEHAKDFVAEEGLRKIATIFSCEYTPSPHIDLWIRIRGERVLKRRGKFNIIPPGTIFASSITLLEEVDDRI